MAKKKRYNISIDPCIWEDAKTKYDGTPMSQIIEEQLLLLLTLETNDELKIRNQITSKKKKITKLSKEVLILTNELYKSKMDSFKGLVGVE